MLKALLNKKLNGIELYFDEIPNEENRTTLKLNDFRWNHKTKAWYTKDTETAREFLKATFNITEYQEATATPGASAKTPTLKTGKDPKQEELKKVLYESLKGCWNDPHMVDYCMKKTAYIVELTSGDIIALDKPSIETNFCFGYGLNGMTTEEEENRAFNMERHARTNEQYFIDKNLRDINDKIEKLQNILSIDYLKVYTSIAYTGESEANKLKNYTYSYYLSDQIEKLDNDPKYTSISNEDIQRIINGLEIVKAQFIKRLETYLKKYGLSKLHTWTYLVD